MLPCLDNTHVLEFVYSPGVLTYVTILKLAHGRIKIVEDKYLKIHRPGGIRSHDPVSSLAGGTSTKTTPPQGKIIFYL
jgi:hypothetical protein